MLRLILAALLFLISLLAVIKAPTNFLWKLQVGITVYPLVFIGITLTVLISCFWLERYKAASLLLSVFALVLLFIPMVRIYMRGSTLPTELLSYFPGAETGSSQPEKPFSFFAQFTGLDVKTVTPVSKVYRTDNGRTWTYDFYPSSIPEKAPCVIVVHSGSWSSGDNKEFPELNSYLANRGYHVAAINYRLAPEFKSPAPVEDVQLLLKTLKAQSADLNIDSSSFFLLGRSAGGQIALCAAYTLQDPSIKGVISFYAPADMVWGASISGNPLIMNTDSVFAAYLGGSYSQYASKYEESSAVAQATKNSPPTLIIHGDNDCMVSFVHSQRLNMRLHELGVPHYFLDLPGATHACDYSLSSPGGQITTFAIERFMASVRQF